MNNMNQFSLGVKHQLFNNEVRKRRLQAGLTQKQLGELAGMSSQTITHIECFRQYPSEAQAVKIADVLSTKPEILFPNWIEYFKKQRTTITTEHFVSERIIDHPEIKLLQQSNEITEELEKEIDKDLLKETFAPLLETLSDKERKVLELRFNLKGELKPGRGMSDGESTEGMTYEEVGREFGVTRERIRQIEAKALRKLKHPTRSKYLKPFVYKRHPMHEE